MLGGGLGQGVRDAAVTQQIPMELGSETQRSQPHPAPRGYFKTPADSETKGPVGCPAHRVDPRGGPGSWNHWGDLASLSLLEDIRLALAVFLSKPQGEEWA